MTLPRAVLLTGATTPTGAAIIDRLLAAPELEHVLAVGLEPEAAWRIDTARVRYVSADLTHPRNLRNLLFGPARELGVTAVVNAAHHRRAQDRGPRVHGVNVEIARELVHLCERHPDIRRFVHLGSAAVYRVAAALPDVLREDSPIELGTAAPQWLRDRVEADLSVTAYFASDTLDVAILRCAECLAPGVGSQLYDYLEDRVCLRPLGFDPMLNVLSLEDLAEAVALALASERRGVFNIPGADTLPLSEVIAALGRRCVPLPGPLLSPLYSLRASLRHRDFRYDLNRYRMHFSAILDGRRAAQLLGYQPRHSSLATLAMTPMNTLP